MTTSGVCFIFLDINIDPPNWQSPSFFVGRCPSSRIFFFPSEQKLTRIMRCMRFACGLLPKKLRGRKRAKKGGHLETLKLMGWFKKPYIPGCNITWLEKPPNFDVILPGKMGTFQRLVEIKTDVKIRELQAHTHHSFCRARFVKCCCCCCC